MIAKKKKKKRARERERDRERCQRNMKLELIFYFPIFVENSRKCKQAKINKK